jgi:hypothetical protein
MLFATPLDRAAKPLKCRACSPVGIGPPGRDARGVAEREPRRLYVGRQILEQEPYREVSEDVPGQDQRIRPVTAACRA